MSWKEGNRVLLKRSSGAWSEGVIIQGRKGHIGIRCVDNGVTREKHIPTDRMSEFVRDIYTQAETRRRRKPTMKRRFNCIPETLGKMVEFGQLQLFDAIQYGDNSNQSCIIIETAEGLRVKDNASSKVYETLNSWAVKEYNDLTKKAIHICYRIRDGKKESILKLRRELEEILREKDQFHSEDSYSESDEDDTPYAQAARRENKKRKKQTKAEKRHKQENHDVWDELLIG